MCNYTTCRHRSDKFNPGLSCWNTCSIQHQLMWQAHNYTGLSWVTVTLFLSPFISRHNVRNFSKQHWVAGEWLRKKNKPAVEDTVNESYGAACQGIIQTVPYYSVFQQLVICLISVLEPNGMVIKTKTDRQSEKGSVWSFFKWNVYFLFFSFLRISAVWIRDSEAIPLWHQRRFHTWQPLGNLKVSLFIRWLTVGCCVLVIRD